MVKSDQTMSELEIMHELLALQLTGAVFKSRCEEAFVVKDDTKAHTELPSWLTLNPGARAFIPGLKGSISLERAARALGERSDPQVQELFLGGEPCDIFQARTIFEQALIEVFKSAEGFSLLAIRALRNASFWAFKFSQEVDTFLLQEGLSKDLALPVDKDEKLAPIKFNGNTETYPPGLLFFVCFKPLEILHSFYDYAEVSFIRSRSVSSFGAQFFALTAQDVPVKMFEDFNTFFLPTDSPDVLIKFVEMQTKSAYEEQAISRMLSRRDAEKEDMVAVKRVSEKILTSALLSAKALDL